MSWVYLLLAILLEGAGTVSMKLSQGFTKWLPSIMVFILYGLSLATLTLALKKIDLSIAYAVWAGIGTALIAGVGILWFREPVTAFEAVSLGLIIVGVVELNLSGGIYAVR